MLGSAQLGSVLIIRLASRFDLLIISEIVNVFRLLTSLNFYAKSNSACHLAVKESTKNRLSNLTGDRICLTTN